jgi:hypothetical protein
VQGKDVILRLKDVDTLEKHVRKHESCPWHATFGQERRGMIHQ